MFLLEIKTIKIVYVIIRVPSLDIQLGLFSAYLFYNGRGTKFEYGDFYCILVQYAYMIHLFDMRHVWVWLTAPFHRVL